MHRWYSIAHLNLQATQRLVYRYIACHGVLLELVLSLVYFLAIVSIHPKVGEIEFENKCQ